MSDRRDINAGGPSVEAVAKWGLLGLIVGAVGVVWTSTHLVATLAGDPAPAGSPPELVEDLATGHTPWTLTTTLIAVAQVVVVATLVTLIVVWMRRRAGRKAAADTASSYMATSTQLTHLTSKGARKTATRLGVPGTATPGVPIGRAVVNNQPLFSSWEDMIVVVAGPRTMKSTAYAIPAITAAPGPVLATSNKRDVVDVTRQLRTEYGTVWVFDPQAVANEPVTWWWNPLTYIAAHDPTTGRAHRDPATGYVNADPARAEKLAGQFCAAALNPSAKTDAYFDGEAENLIGLMLLAAAVGERSITEVYGWLATPSEVTPIQLLAAHGLQLHEQSLYALANLAEKQRDGVYGTARARMGFLRNPSMTKWVTPPIDPTVRQFHPVDYAHSTDTLYPLSKEGEGSAGPLVAALTVAVIDALETLATNSPGGRLQVPFLAVLDEAANICRFRNLDSYYSHFGSRGIIIETILQNWAQGEEVWGVKGMEKLWSAANIKIYGGGVDDDRFLKRLSELIGTHTYRTRSQSVNASAGLLSRGGYSTSTSVHERSVLTVGQLRELRGRAVVFASGTPAVLVKPVPWFNGPDANRIQASADAAAAPARIVEPTPPGVDLDAWNAKGTL